MKVLLSNRLNVPEEVFGFDQASGINDNSESEYENSDTNLGNYDSDGQEFDKIPYVQY